MPGSLIQKPLPVLTKSTHSLPKNIGTQTHIVFIDPHSSSNNIVSNSTNDNKNINNHDLADNFNTKPLPFSYYASSKNVFTHKPKSKSHSPTTRGIQNGAGSPSTHFKSKSFHIGKFPSQNVKRNVYSKPHHQQNKNLKLNKVQ